MRIREIITEDQNLNELDWKSGLGKVGRGIGQVAAVPQGLGRAIRQGYRTGVQAIGGPPIAPGPTTPAASGTTSAATGAATSPVSGTTAQGTAPASGETTAAPVSVSGTTGQGTVPTGRIEPTLRSTRPTAGSLSTVRSSADQLFTQIQGLRTRDRPKAISYLASKFGFAVPSPTTAPVKAAASSSAAVPTP